MDAALQRKLQAFGSAAAEHGMQVTVHERPRGTWQDSLNSFGQRATMALAAIAGAWGAGQAMQQADAQKAQQRPQSAIVQAHESMADNESIVAPSGSKNVAAANSQDLQPNPNIEAWEKPQFQQLREKLQYVEVVDKKNKNIQHSVLTPSSQFALVKAVYDELGLKKHGIAQKDLYAVISAETAWQPRNGMGANRVVSSGLAQFEPATAKSVGIKDPHDPIQAVWGAGVLLREAADWSKSRVDRSIHRHGLHMTKSQQEAAVKDGYSIYYNTSAQLREKWEVKNTSEFPAATRHHISNSRYGRTLHDSIQKRELATVNYLGGKAFPNDPKPNTQGMTIEQQIQANKDALAASLVDVKRAETAKSLQKSVDQPCKIELRNSKLATPGPVLHTMCSDKAGQMRDGLAADTARLGKVIEIGSTRGIPVFMTSGAPFSFGAQIREMDTGHAIFIEDTLIKKMQTDINDESARSKALAFIIGHEIAHIEVNSRMSRAQVIHLTGGNADQKDLTKNEMDADAEGLNVLESQGLSSEEAKESARLALKVTHNYFAETRSFSSPNQEFVLRMLAERAQTIGISGSNQREHNKQYAH